MIASLGRYLHQPINDVEAWDLADFFAYYFCAAELLVDREQEVEG